MRFWINTIPSTKKFQALKNLRFTLEISVNLDWFELKCTPRYLIKSSHDNVWLHKIKSSKIKSPILIWWSKSYTAGLVTGRHEFQRLACCAWLVTSIERLYYGPILIQHDLLHLSNAYMMVQIWYSMTCYIYRTLIWWSKSDAAWLVTSIERLYDGPNLMQHDLLQVDMSLRDSLVVLQQLSIFCKPDIEGAIRIISSAKSKNL